jgi:hypothetical protein
MLRRHNDASPLQFLSVGLAAYGDAPGDHGGGAQPFEAVRDFRRRCSSRDPFSNNFV